MFAFLVSPVGLQAPHMERSGGARGRPPSGDGWASFPLFLPCFWTDRLGWWPAAFGPIGSPGLSCGGRSQLPAQHLPGAPLFSRLCLCVRCSGLLSGPLSSCPPWLARQFPFTPSRPRHRWQGPRCPVRVAASCATHTPGSRCMGPLLGSWTPPQWIPGLSAPTMGTPCVYTTVEQTSSVSSVLCGSQGRPCVPGSVPGAFDSALAAGPIPGAAGQLPDLPLRAPPGQPQVPNRLSLSVGSPLPPWGLGTTMGFIPRILRRLFKPQMALPSAMQQCPGLCLQP